MRIFIAQRHLFHWCGIFLAFIGILFIGFRLHSHSLDLNFSDVKEIVWVFIAGLSIVYGVANLFLAKAWWHLLHHFRLPILYTESAKIYGISQLVKYIPGNIFHLAGRQALGMAAGLPPRALAKSMVLELALLSVAAAQFAWLLLFLFRPHFPDYTILFFLLSSVTLTGVVLGYIFGRKVLYSFLWQFFFMFFSGVIFIVLLMFISGIEELTMRNTLTILGCYITAWLVGLVTPGAPAGIGIRESILLFTLNGIVEEKYLLLAVLLGRFITIIGDCLTFVIAYFAPQKKHRDKILSLDRFTKEG